MFFDRERELEKLLKLVSSEPNLITFVYGPINSGKTALMMEFIKKLPPEYVAFYINLRRTPVTSYDDFVDVLFSVEFRSRVKTLEEAASLVLSAGKEAFGFPVPAELLEAILREKKPKNAFTYIATLMEEVRKADRKPVLILDELQVIRDLKAFSKENRKELEGAIAQFELMLRESVPVSKSTIDELRVLLHKVQGEVEG